MSKSFDGVAIASDSQTSKCSRYFIRIAAVFVVLVLAVKAFGVALPYRAPHSDPFNSTDAMFKEPYIDIDEWRDKPVRHRYVHGGFKGTKALFSIYFPPKDEYQGRFFQHITPAPASETLDEVGVGSSGTKEHMMFSLASGAYFVQTNEGGPTAIAGDQTIRARLMEISTSTPMNTQCMLFLNMLTIRARCVPRSFSARHQWLASARLQLIKFCSTRPNVRSLTRPSSTLSSL